MPSSEGVNEVRAGAVTVPHIKTAIVYQRLVVLPGPIPIACLSS